MPSERIQRRIDALLDEADTAVSDGDWQRALERAEAALAFDPASGDAAEYRAAALRMLEGATESSSAAPAVPSDAPSAGATPALAPSERDAPPESPESFAGGRYKVLRFLGEGGKKRVFLAHDALLDRDIAFSLIKTEGLDDVGRERIMREAQAMGRLTHPNIVSIYDIGEHVAPDGSKQPYLVQELMGGGDVEDLLKDADGPLSLRRSLEIAISTAKGLEFAHAQGVIHRDLKPGNVWLTSDGVAKIGDLGLAVTLGQSRLTSHGMMVGTYGYMPPEQALGQEVTPQADLYSLGAMLYELVTGRPPFQGDTPTAVISQHLNTQPVAPSWYTEHCPPDLEVLILSLLAKVPSDRPASAEEVIATLEAVNPEARSASHSDSSANPLDRLARGVFVGRDRELERLRSAFDEARRGRGSVVMLVGEPGIGKTRTTQELETYARMRGARTIWGRSHEAAGAPPYRPWVQAGDTFSRLFGLDGVTPLLTADDIAELSRIFSGLREQPGYVPPEDVGDPDAAQFRLFEAYTRFMAACANDAPLVVVLDDLHWADKPSLLLLRHLAREISRLPLLIVGTYRDTELARTHPLSETLAELNREGGFQRISLLGLSKGEVATYIRTVAGVDPSPILVDRVHEETEGNPFFLSEVVNLMTEEGTIDQLDVSSIQIPEGVREALGRRLDRLSEEANELLSVAAVAGREFAYETLQLLSEHSSEDLIQLIEEGLAARVIEESEQAGRYRFTHALMQETLLEEISTTRRLRIHGQIAEVLERRYGDAADERASRLAPHFTESAGLNRDHLQKAVHYSRIAGEAAEAQAGWSEAARHYANIATLMEDSPNGPEFVPILTALGRCRRWDGDHRDAWKALMRARSLAQVLGDPIGVARASVELDGLMAPPGRVGPLIDEAIAGLDGITSETSLEFQLLLVRRALGLQGLGLPESMDVRLRTLASTGAVDDELLARYEAQELRLLVWESGDFSEFVQRASSLLERLPLQGGATQLPGLLGGGYAMRAQLDEAEPAWRDAADIYRRSGAKVGEQNTRIALAALKAVHGQLAEAEAVLDEVPGFTEWKEFLRVRIAEVSGDLGAAERLIPDDARARAVPILFAIHSALEARIKYEGGSVDGAEASIQRCLDALVDSRHSNYDNRRLIAIAELDRCLADLIPEDAASELLDELESRSFIRYEPFSGSNLDLARGYLAIRLGKLDEAEHHFRTGLEWCEREGCPVEAARCHQGIAEIAEQRGDTDGANDHLETAGELFAQHGAKLYVDQVIAKKEILKA
jgi:tetratricopeptide (TPR) repeat protein